MDYYIKPFHRLIGLVMYAGVLIAIQSLLFGLSLLPDEKAIWLYSGLFSLLISNRLTNPYFTPPLDALINAFAALVAFLSMLLVVNITPTDSEVIKAASISCGLLLFISLVVLIGRDYFKSVFPHWLLILDRITRLIGDGNVIFTFTILTSVYLFHRNSILEAGVILSAWILIHFKPVENFLGFINWCSQTRPIRGEELIGEVVGYQIPGLALIKVKNAINDNVPNFLVIYNQEGKGHLGITIGNVGRDDGILIRTLMLPMPTTLLASLAPVKGRLLSNRVFKLDLEKQDLQAIPDSEAGSLAKSVDRLCGIVDHDTSTTILNFEVTDDTDLAEGRLVETKIGNRSVLYQIIDGLTKEDVIQQKEKYGYARAKSRKIGLWDETKKKFVPIPWLPKINSPVLLAHKEEFEVIKDAVGHFPHTNYHAGINISEAVTHNTAILGILGIGKSCLAIELVERMVTEGVQVICLDLTNQYKNELSSLIDLTYVDGKVAALKQKLPGASNANKDDGGNRKVFKATLKTELSEFLDNTEQKIIILNPTEFNVWKQPKDQFRGEAAPLEPLSAAEITAYVSEMALQLVQAKGMTDQARLCLVYEEAHSLIPEWNSVAQDGDKYATALTSRAILQGRKFGMGCLLITQRTANVTKTILNQCNTIFAMRTFDDTGREFLSNYIGGDYASSLASLEARHAVFYGKASTCENPVLIRLNDRHAFLEVFRRADGDVSVQSPSNQ